jgi:polysaccharide biosynthesis/export protein
MKARRTRVLGLVGVIVLLATCGFATPPQQETLASSANTNGTETRSSQDASHPAPTARNPRYRICLDDVLLLSFPLSPELNQKVTVQPDGFIMLPTVGGIHVVGLTLAELADAVKKAYAGTLHEPIVDVDLADFQRPFFTVLGQVGKPGQYDLRYDITVTQAIAVAGGFAATAKTQVFLYRAVSSNWAEVRELKIKELLQGKNIAEDVHLRPGDMIFVPEKAITKFRKYVPYGVGIGTSVSPYPSAY